MAEKKSPRSAKQIEADLAATRERLSATVDELAYKVHPKTLLNEQKAKTQEDLLGLIKYPDGRIRYQRIAMVLGCVGGAAIALGGLRSLFWRPADR